MLEYCIGFSYSPSAPDGMKPPRLQGFLLTDIERMREKVMEQPNTSPLILGGDTGIYCYDYPFYKNQINGKNYYSMTSALEGLCIKTYQSDIYNNWLNKEWIDSTASGSINEITKIDTSAGYFTLDDLILKNKIFNILNRVAVSDGSYDAWQLMTYGITRTAETTKPTYHGGFSSEIVFDQVISNAGTAKEPLGTIAGRGTLGNKHKGGRVEIKVDEPCIIQAIASITPRIDYSQGNRWYNTYLGTWNDLHKPELDGIGWQNLMLDQMAYHQTEIEFTEAHSKTVGKQPAWINYMTDVNEVFGSFANTNDQMYMVLNRRYSLNWDNGNYAPQVRDTTTYIDPSKYNYIFADTRIDAQNFLVQIALDIKMRAKMSAKQIPNL